jgi:hypothetical protein
LQPAARQPAIFEVDSSRYNTPLIVCASQWRRWGGVEKNIFSSAFEHFLILFQSNLLSIEKEVIRKMFINTSLS